MIKDSKETSKGVQILYHIYRKNTSSQENESKL